MEQEFLEKIIQNDEFELLRCKYTTNLERFRNLISSQDLLRRVMCTESGETYIELKRLDKCFSKAINNFAVKHNNQKFEG